MTSPSVQPIRNLIKMEAMMITHKTILTYLQSPNCYAQFK